MGGLRSSAARADTATTASMPAAAQSQPDTRRLVSSDLILSIGQRPCLESSPRAVEVRRARRAPLISCRLSQRFERCAHLGTEDRRLFPGGEMTAFVELVVVDELGIRPLRPTARGRIDLVGAGAHG